MGYSIIIGEMPSKEMDEPPIVKMSGAPAFGELTDCTNQRFPSYITWENFTRVAGLYNLFYDKRSGLMRKHPGIEHLTRKHKTIIDRAIRAYESKHDVGPSSGKKFSYKTIVDMHFYPSRLNQKDDDWNYNRLVWLKFWVDWALRYCKKPVLFNR